VSLTFELLRQDDLLALTVELRNVRLDKTNPKAPLLTADKATDPAYLIVHFQPQTILERAYFETAPIASPPFNQPPPPPDPTVDPLKPPGQVPVRMGGPSRLVFQLPPGFKPIPLTIESLLDWSRLKLVVSPIAAVLPQGPIPSGLKIAAPKDLETYFELPYRLYLSPNSNVGWLHAKQPVTHSGRSELWHTRLARLITQGKPPVNVAVDPTALNTIALRAIWSPDFRDHQALPGFFDNTPFLAPMTRRDRDEIVILTSGFEGYFVEVTNPATGQTQRLPFKPTPIQASRLFLTTLGGWLSSRGHWDPLPSYEISTASVATRAVAPAAVVPSVQPLELTEWVHQATEARDHYVKIVYDGYLYPFGHRASLVKVTERKFIGGDQGVVNSPVAYLRQRMYIVVRELEKSYPAASYTSKGREMPLRARIALKTVVTPEIDPPGSSQVPGSAASFWVRVQNADFPFHVNGEDLAGIQVDFLGALIFVPVSETSLQSVQKQYATSGARRSFTVHSQNVTYADPAAGDTALKTTALNFDTQPVKATPPFTPKLDGKDAATVIIPALEALIGGSPQIDIHLYSEYLSKGLDQHAGVFAQINLPPPVKFTAGKSGGFATPNLSASGISARKGVVAGSVSDAATGLIDPGAFFADVSAKLFGVIPLKNLIPVNAINKADAKTNAPEIRTQSIPNQKNPKKVVTKVSWAPQLQNYPLNTTASSPLQIQFNTDNNKSALTLHATLERYLDGAPPTSQIKGELSNFLITLFGVIGLRVSSITFNSTNGSKTDVAAHLPASNPIAFLGALQFVQAIADVLPPGLFGGAGPSITLAPSYVKVSYTLGLPSLSVGVLSLEHIALTTGLDLPYLDGKPAFEFAFASRSSPFLITVECLGGGGFVHLIVNADGVQMVEGALEFGGEFSIDLGVASGGVHIMAGIYFQLTNTATTLTGFVDIGGEVSVLGIISISIDLNLSLSFIHTSQGDKVQGRATLTISVHVFFFGISASVSVEKSFGSGKGDPRVRQLIGPTDWAAYAAAFA
jgi:hypothetical protein